MSIRRRNLFCRWAWDCGLLRARFSGRAGRAGILPRAGGAYSNTPTDFWGHFTEALRTGLPQNELRGGGVPLFEALDAGPARLKSFLAAMTGISAKRTMPCRRTAH